MNRWRALLKANRLSTKRKRTKKRSSEKKFNKGQRRQSQAAKRHVQPEHHSSWTNQNCLQTYFMGTSTFLITNNLTLQFQNDSLSMQSVQSQVKSWESSLEFGGKKYNELIWRAHTLNTQEETKHNNLLQLSSHYCKTLWLGWKWQGHYKEDICIW